MTPDRPLGAPQGALGRQPQGGGVELLEQFDRWRLG